MRIAVWANDELWNMLNPEGNQFLSRVDHFNNHMVNDFDAFIQLIEYNPAQTLINSSGKPYFLNDVAGFSKKLSNDSIIRFNGWNGFVSKPAWEICGNITTDARAVLEQINKNFIAVPDVPGMISARVISMIINEAYFALEEKVSSKTDIDTAMKLGTNYPYGPFEWCELIGKENVYQLLSTLAETNPVYTPAPLLKKELN